MAVTGLTRDLPVSSVQLDPFVLRSRDPVLRVTARSASGGAVLTTHLMPEEAGTPALLLEVRVRDNNRAQVIVLGLLQEEEPLSGPRKDPVVREFYLRYADVDRYLQQHNPSLHLRAGDVLAVQAVWSRTHGAPVDRLEGGFGGGGTVVAPPELGAAIPPTPIKAYELAGPRSTSSGLVPDSPVGELPFGTDTAQERWLDSTRSDARLERKDDRPPGSAP